MEIIFFRHGATEGNLKKLYVGSTDEPLAQKGIEEAQKAKENATPVDMVYRSPMKRCEETADILYPDNEKTIVDALHETNFGDFEGKKYDELCSLPEYQAWLNGADPPNGEGKEKATKRVTEGFLSLLAHAKKNGYEKIAIVCHGGTIMSIMSKYAYPKGDYFDFLLPNCGYYKVNCDMDTPVLTIIDGTPTHNFLAGQGKNTED